MSEKFRIFADIVKADKGYIKRRATQCFDNTEVGVILFVVDCMMYHMISPGTHLSPAVQNCYLFYAVRCCSLNIVIQSTEFPAHGFDVFYKIRELDCQFQITAVTDSLDWASKDRTPCCYPVDFCFFYRISALMEGIRKEIWQKSSFCVFHMFNITEKAQCCTVSNTSDNCIQSDGCKLIHKWFHTDPVIPHEHHGFSSVFMHNIYHFLCKCSHLTALECLKIFKFF